LVDLPSERWAVRLRAGYAARCRAWSRTRAGPETCGAPRL